ncbi:MAG: CBS domain-containing protein [Proteobacteria bacterium]|nr:CBS domain-containing protein [Pseudomonadota bacterium]MBU1611962.1 CBS domain-containing protein [Pseudomonadota bacterium]
MMTVKDVMTTKVLSLRESDSLSVARSLMDMHRIRHIPIVGVEDRFIGLITHRDLLGATISHLADVDPETQKEIDAGVPIKEVMRSDLHTVDPDDQLIEAAKTLLNNKYGCLPVVKDGRLVGIITEADFLKLTIELLDALDKKTAS